MRKRWNVFGTPVFGDVAVVRLLKRLDDGALQQVFAAARDQGQSEVELKGQQFMITRNSDYTFTIAPSTDDHRLISR